MKILLFSPTELPVNGGMAVWTKNYMQGCNSIHNEVRLVSSTYIEGEHANLYNENKVKFCMKLLLKVKQMLQEEKFDVVHFNTCCSFPGTLRDLIFIKLMRHNNIPVVLHCHCDMAFFTKNSLEKKICAHLLNSVNRIICMNSSSIKRVKELTGKESLYVPNPIKESVIKKANKINKNINSIVYMGFINKEKGSYEIIEIAKRLSKYKFIMVGKDEEQVSHMAIDIPNMKFMGELPHSGAIDILAMSDLLIFPSHAEGFPMTVLESMAVGTPIVATKVGAVEDMVCKENKEFLCNVGDVEKLCESIEKIEDISIRKKISKNNQKKVLEEYLEKIVYEKLSRIYEEAISVDL